MWDFFYHLVDFLRNKIEEDKRKRQRGRRRNVRDIKCTLNKKNVSNNEK